MVLQVVNRYGLVKLLAVSLLALFLGGCTSGSPASGEISQVTKLMQAQQRYQQAMSQGYAWRAHRLALEDASQAIAAGDVARAEVAIERANLLADASQSQAIHEAQVWQTRVPFNE